jgi:very-short-patch-repair endonuclease
VRVALPGAGAAAGGVDEDAVEFGFGGEAVGAVPERGADVEEFGAGEAFLESLDTALGAVGGTDVANGITELEGADQAESVPLLALVSKVYAAPLLRPVNDNFAQASPLAGSSLSTLGTNLFATLEPPFVRSCCDEALRRKWTNLDKLDATIERNLRRPGLTQLRALTHELRGGNGPTESELEHLVRELLRAGDFPEPDRQKAIRTGARLRRVDFIFSSARVIIEADGYAYHSGLTAFEDDRRRNNSLMARGYVVLHWTWKALHEEPGRLLGDLAVCLRRTL